MWDALSSSLCCSMLYFYREMREICESERWKEGAKLDRPELRSITRRVTASAPRRAIYQRTCLHVAVAIHTFCIYYVSSYLPAYLLRCKRAVIVHALNSLLPVIFAFDARDLRFILDFSISVYTRKSTFGSRGKFSYS